MNEPWEIPLPDWVSSSLTCAGENGWPVSQSSYHQMGPEKGLVRRWQRFNWRINEWVSEWMVLHWERVLLRIIKNKCWSFKNNKSHKVWGRARLKWCQMWGWSSARRMFFSAGVCADPLCNLLGAQKDTLAISTWVSTSFVSRCIVGLGLPGSRIWWQLSGFVCQWERLAGGGVSVV